MYRAILSSVLVAFIVGVGCSTSSEDSGAKAGKGSTEAKPLPSKSGVPPSSKRAAALRDALTLFETWVTVRVHATSAGPDLTTEEIENLMKATDLASSILREKGLQEGLLDAAREVAQRFKAERVSVVVSSGPTISEIRQRLGDEDATEPGEFKDPTTPPPAFPEPLTWHKYGWLHFGGIRGEVRLIRVECKDFLARASGP